MRLLGIDPGANTGLAVIDGLQLVSLETIEPLHIERRIIAIAPDRVVFEDSRLETKLWTTNRVRAVAMSMARKVGEVDAWCKLIAAACGELRIACHGISPTTKGAKVNAAMFEKITGWPAGKSNEHERDACMVAYRFRRAG